MSAGSVLRASFGQLVSRSVPRRKGTISLTVAAIRPVVLDMVDWMAANCEKSAWINTRLRPSEYARWMRSEDEKLEIRNRQRKHPRGHGFWNIKPQAVKITFRSDNDYMLFMLKWDGLVREYDRMVRDKEL